MKWGRLRPLNQVNLIAGGKRILKARKNLAKWGLNSVKKIEIVCTTDRFGGDIRGFVLIIL